MPGTESKDPRPAWVEDFDEETQTALPSTRATANAAVKRSPAGRGTACGQVKYMRDGSDSGYSSKAGTFASISTNKTNGKKPRNLKVDTSVHERERQAYSMTAQHQANASLRSHDRVNGAHQAPASGRGGRFKHLPTVCWVCDQFGYHLDDRELAKLPQLASTMLVKKPSKGEQHEAQKKLRRQSSVRESRPAVVYAPPTRPTFYPVTPTYAPPAAGISTTPIPVQPQMPYAPEQVVYSYPHVAPPTPQYAVEPAQPDYFIALPAGGDQSSKSRRPSSSANDHPVIHHAQPREERATAGITSSQRTHPSIKPRQSSRSAEQRRADREAMPPPPVLTRQLSRRSSSKDSAVYSVDPPRPSAHHTHDPSPGWAPPSAYRHVEPAAGASTRPPMRRKSVSYPDPAVRGTQQVAAAAAAGRPPPAEASTSSARRHTTSLDKSCSHDRKARNAEAYMERNSKLTAEQLSVEKIAEMKASQRAASSRSETGSNLSQASQHSSSKSSSAYDNAQPRGRRASIMYDSLKIDISQDALERSRPLSMQFDGLSISVGSKDKAAGAADRRDQKLIEKSPSVASGRSKRSTADSNHGSSKAKAKDRN